MRSIEEILDSLDLSYYDDYDKNDCLLYIIYMMTGNEIKPISTLKVPDYYRNIYKYVDMLVDEEFQQETQKCST